MSLLSQLSKQAKVLIVLFTVVEVITLVAWLIFALPSGATASLHSGRALLAIVILVVGLLIEHTLSTIAGKV